MKTLQKEPFKTTWFLPKSKLKKLSIKFDCRKLQKKNKQSIRIFQHGFQY